MEINDVYMIGKSDLDLICRHVFELFLVLKNKDIRSIVTTH